MLCITEIKPKSGTIPQKEMLQLDGYDLHINDAYNNPDTRGVAIYTKQSLNAVSLDTPEIKFKDAAWIKLPGKHKDNITCL